ncbi:uncharacterized protein LOC141911829 isoform X1 [Tubulanus polymorphus]|uniref:uncharacterized protein LOC141911829 isoform X1 n=1 Tax=Tubulanus polymorphus TaxID=672921 RepID=UPI003DA27874
MNLVNSASKSGVLRLISGRKSIFICRSKQQAIAPGVLVANSFRYNSDTNPPTGGAANNDDEIFKKKEPKHPETPQFPDDYNPDPPKGKIYDKKPFKVELIAGKRYSWCSCGYSRNQPFCDMTHKLYEGTNQIKMYARTRPFAFTVTETKDYWLCNCKQSNKRPFCDGTHRRDDIQSAIR